MLCLGICNVCTFQQKISPAAVNTVYRLMLLH